MLLRIIPAKRKKALSQLIASAALRDSLTVKNAKDLRPLKAGLLTVSLAALTVGLAGPQWGFRPQEVPVLNSNVIVALDVSDSMLAQDLKPSRFERSKLEIVEAFAKPGNQTAFRIGLVTFAGRAYLQCPLTLDTGALKFLLETLTPGMLPYPGTNIAAALKTSISVFGASAGQRHILLVTDGEDHEGGARGLIGQLQKNKIRVSALWAGSPAGEPIPLKDESGSFLGYKKDRGGQTVVSKADGSTLEEISRATGGKFLRLDNNTNPQEELRSLLEESDGQKNKGTQMEMENRFQIPLGIGFILLLVEFVMPEKRKSGKGGESGQGGKGEKK
ncbi:MAG: VWA domain-containing protein [Elusimicrobia bacterium]|nr:VWA domain-containing protein [Elusimicrobiota bacterium]